MGAQQAPKAGDSAASADTKPTEWAGGEVDAPAAPLRRLSTDPKIRATRAILADLFGPPSRRSFDVRVWDGSVEGPATWLPSRSTLVLERPGGLRRMLLPPSELTLGEAYLRGDFDVEGDLEDAVGLGDALTERLRSPVVLARLLPGLLSLPAEGLLVGTGGDGRPEPRLPGRRHSRRRDSAAVRFHYSSVRER